jgi:hypothetical protein
MVLSGTSELLAEAKKIAPLIFGRIRKDFGIGEVIRELVSPRLFGFDVERAVFLTVLHRLLASGSDRSCSNWHRDTIVAGIEGLELHHLYRAMAFR